MNERHWRTPRKPSPEKSALDPVGAGPLDPGSHGPLSPGTLLTETRGRQHTDHVTPEGAAWLASASASPGRVKALWSARPTAPSVLPCGRAFDVVTLPALFGRRVLEQLWDEGPGSGPVALHRDRVLLLVTPGTAQRLPALLAWEEWASAIPSLLCHGAGDAVTLPPLHGPAPATRWVVAPDTRHPWLPGADVLLWAGLRAARPTARPTPRESVPALVSAPVSG